MIENLERAGCVLALVAVATACGGGSAPQMIAVAPPDGWQQAIVADRLERDTAFRMDPESPIHPEDRASFQGLDHWAPDPAYRFVGPIHVYESPEPFTVITTTGKSRPCVRYGWIGFSLHGRDLTLQVYQLQDIDAPNDLAALFLPFTDATSGNETYPAGRYIDVGRDDQGRYVVDFNDAHNPLCAYGMPERYACPVTPGENRLTVRVEAGEKGYRRRH